MMAYFPPRQTNTKSLKSGAAFDALKRDIMLGVLEPGTGLTELELAAHFQCSQGTVREALLQLQEEGLRVPEDVSVVGFDNWDVMATATRPPLTTVDPRLDELGRLAAESVLAMLQKRGLRVTRIQ